MKGYRQFCPVALGAEIFAERWVPLIVREPLLGSEHFGELLDGVPGIPRSMLSQRLRRLADAGIVARVASPDTGSIVYRLTDSGKELGSVVEALGAWGYRHAARDLRQEHLDPALAVWFLRRRIRLDRLPAARVVVRFDFRESRVGPRWLVIDSPDVDVCLTEPGFDTDLVVTTDPTRSPRCTWVTSTLGRPSRTHGSTSRVRRRSLGRSRPGSA
jgi:DNA-binding HxlR family transcriptional regulator